MMKRTRHTPEQVIRKLRDADRMLAEQRSIAEIAKELGVSENTYHRWRNQFGGMKADDVKRLKELERENQRFSLLVRAGKRTSIPVVYPHVRATDHAGHPLVPRCNPA